MSSDEVNEEYSAFTLKIGRLLEANGVVRENELVPLLIPSYAGFNLHQNEKTTT